MIIKTFSQLHRERLKKSIGACIKKWAKQKPIHRTMMIYSPKRKKYVLIDY